MQILDKTPTVVNAFAIAVPCITLGTALFVFNLEHLLNIWTSLTCHCTTWLRLRMRQHRRKDWKDRAIALHEDIAVARAPVRKAQRQSSGWVYLLFLSEYLFVALPVGEIAAVMRVVKLLGKRNHAVSGGTPAHQRRASVLVEHGDDTAADSATSRQEQRKERIKQRINQSLEDEKRKEKARRYDERGRFVSAVLKSRKPTLHALKKILLISLTFFRALLIPLWIAMLSMEYIVLAAALLLRSRLPSSTPQSNQPSGPSEEADTTSRSIPIQAWEILGLSSLLPLRTTPISPPNADNQDFEIRAVTRVATRLGGITSPSIMAATTTSPSMNSSLNMNIQHYNTSTTHLINHPTTPTPNFNSTFNSLLRQQGVSRTDTSLTQASRTQIQHAEDILRVSPPTRETRTESVVRKARRARRFVSRGGGGAGAGGGGGGGGGGDSKLEMERIGMEDVALNGKG
jgi:hypothetical protein